MNKLKILSVDRIHSAVETHSGKASKASRDSLHSSSKEKVHHRLETYSMSLRKCLVVKVDQECEASKFKPKGRM